MKPLKLKPEAGLTVNTALEAGLLVTVTGTVKVTGLPGSKLPEDCGIPKLAPGIGV